MRCVFPSVLSPAGSLQLCWLLNSQSELLLEIFTEILTAGLGLSLSLFMLQTSSFYKHVPVLKMDLVFVSDEDVRAEIFLLAQRGLIMS